MSRVEYSFMGYEVACDSIPQDYQKAVDVWFVDYQGKNVSQFKTEQEAREWIVSEVAHKEKEEQLTKKAHDEVLEEQEAREMSPDGFQKWLDTMGYTRQEAADKLDMSYKTICRYVRGETKIPRYIQYACQWIAAQRLMVAKKRQA